MEIGHIGLEKYIFEGFYVYNYGNGSHLGHVASIL